MNKNQIEIICKELFKKSGSYRIIKIKKIINLKVIDRLSREMRHWPKENFHCPMPMITKLYK